MSSDRKKKLWTIPLRPGFSWWNWLRLMWNQRTPVSRLSALWEEEMGNFLKHFWKKSVWELKLLLTLCRSTNVGRTGETIDVMFPFAKVATSLPPLPVDPVWRGDRRGVQWRLGSEVKRSSPQNISQNLPRHTPLKTSLVPQRQEDLQGLPLKTQRSQGNILFQSSSDWKFNFQGRVDFPPSIHDLM